MTRSNRPKKRFWLWLGLGTLALVLGGLALASELERDALVWRYADKVDSPDPQLRRDAIRNIGLQHQRTWLLRGHGERIVLKALDDPDTEVRNAAVYSLEYMKDRARPAIPRLFELLKESNPSTRIKAVRLLIDLGPHPPLKPEPEVIGLLSADDSASRHNGLAEVIRHGRAGKPMIRSVAEITDDVDAGVRGLSVDILVVLDTKDAIDHEATDIMVAKYRTMAPDDPRRREMAERFKTP